jgi:hypothetical protein
MPHPKVRTWTLATLDRSTAYRLWFDPVAYRWEVCPEGGDGAPLRTRDESGPPARKAQPRTEGPGSDPRRDGAAA